MHALMHCGVGTLREKTIIPNLIMFVIYSQKLNNLNLKACIQRQVTFLVSKLTVGSKHTYLHMVFSFVGLLSHNTF